MHSAQYILTLLTVATTTFAAPTNSSLAASDAADLAAAGRKACGATATVNDDGYTVMANVYDAEGGSACATEHGHNKNGIQWSTTFNFPSDPYSVKAYPNAYLSDHKKVGDCKPLSKISKISTTWKWDYDVKSAIKGDVAYDMFLTAGGPCTPVGSHTYEVMVWLANYGGLLPLGNVIDHFTYKDNEGNKIEFALYRGTNFPNNVDHVYSFLPTKGNVKNFSGNLAAFLHKAGSHDKAMGGATLQSVQAGTETVTGSATFKVSEYSLGS